LASEAKPEHLLANAQHDRRTSKASASRVNNVKQVGFLFCWQEYEVFAALIFVLAKIFARQKYFCEAKYFEREECEAKCYKRESDKSNCVPICEENEI
jgi:hypothetical protein